MLHSILLRVLRSFFALNMLARVVRTLWWALSRRSSVLGHAPRMWGKVSIIIFSLQARFLQWGLPTLLPPVPRLDVRHRVHRRFNSVRSFTTWEPTFVDAQALVVVQQPYHSTPIPLSLNSFHLLNSLHLNSVRIASEFRSVTGPKRARDCASSWRRSRTASKCGSWTSASYWAMVIFWIEASHVTLNIPRPRYFFPV